MILLIEPDLTIRKRLSDLLNRERIIGKSSLTEAVEILCRYKDDINLIITNVHILSNEVKRQTIAQLCRKLSFETPPLLGFYTKQDVEHVQDFKTVSKNYRLVNYDEKDPEFPAEYLGVISELFPAVNYDSVQAIKTWNEDQKSDDLEELHQWLKEEGINLDEPGTAAPGSLADMASSPLKDIEKSGLLKKNPSPSQKADFEKMYNELKKKYDELYRLMQELTAVVKEPTDHE